MLSINFTPEQMATLDKAVQHLPYYIAVSFISHINAEIQRNHNERADASDKLAGQVVLKDPYAGD